MPSIEYDPDDLHEIIVLSSDEEASQEASLPRMVERRKTKTERLREEVKALKKAKSKLEAALAAAISRTQADRATLDQIKEHTVCRVCLQAMWTPYMLGCGHSFCKRCLEVVFDRKLREHGIANPAYELCPPAVQYSLESLREPDLSAFDAYVIRQRLRDWQDGIVGPKYCCPFCRARVVSAPVECFALKNVVRCTEAMVGQSAGEEWDRFFLPIPQPRV